MSRIASYSIGLLLAIVLTLAAFGLVVLSPHTTHAVLIPIILALAMTQLVVQMYFFLHLGQGKDSRWNAALFGFTFFGILVIVVASVWIMYHLNTNMTPTQINQYIINQSGI